MIEIGAQHRDRDLQALGLQRQGQVLLTRGEVAAGLESIDEAVVAAIAGELSPYVTAAVYCSAISCCRELTDYERTSEWSQAVSRWCEREQCTGFPGLCRIYTAELAGLHGDWNNAQAELERACDELTSFGALAMAAGGYYELGEIHRRRGQLEQAETAYAQASEHGHDPQPGLALLGLARGDTQAATTAINRALADATYGPKAGSSAAETDKLRRARLLPAQVEICVAANDTGNAATAADELQAIAAEYNTKALHAYACTARARVCLAQHDLDDALPAARRARTLWTELQAPYEAARTQMIAAAVHCAAGDIHSEQIELRAARATFERLGAAIDLAAATTALGSPTAPIGATLGLTARELDVLRLVANGLTDAQIAEQLYLSPHTVHRHLANIRTKTNQPSRSAAVAQATRLGLI